jgi:predicted GTPase
MQSKEARPVVVVIGSTGTGKSSLCNILCGHPTGQRFMVWEKADSCTNITTKHIEKWFGTGSEFVLIDTPGLGDSKGRDSVHIAEMVDKLKETDYINAFIIVFNGANSRLDEHLKAMMTLFEKCSMII